MPGYLRSATSSTSDDGDEALVGHDAGSQAWGDYLEEIEGYEI